MSIKDVTGVSITPTFPRFPTPSIKQRSRNYLPPQDPKARGKEAHTLLQSVKKFISLFLKEKERPLFKNRDAYERLITRTPDPKNTYAPPPLLWPASNKKKEGGWPYLIATRPEENTTKAPFNDKLLAKLRSPLKGRLMMDSSGYLYLKIPEKVVHAVLTFIHPDSSRIAELENSELLGSHVRVMTPHETKTLLSHRSIDEIGDEFYFSLKECFVSTSSEREAWHLSIDCPQLDALREKYTGNRSKKKNPSLLTSLIALKEPQKERPLFSLETGYFLINPSVCPA